MGRKDKNIEMCREAGTQAQWKETASKPAIWNGGIILGESFGKYSFKKIEWKFQTFFELCHEL